MVPVGATVAVFMQPAAGQVSTVLKMFSGGTLEILPCSQTLLSGLGGLGPNTFLPAAQAAATLAALSGSGYAMSAAEVLSISGPASYYLSATSATCVLHALFGKSQGY